MMKINRFFYLLLVAMVTTTSQAQTLPTCPDSPNCVSSQANQSDTTHYIAPFKITDPAKVWQALEQALLQQGRTVITDKTEEVIKAEVTSLLFRFVDDVDVILDASNQIINIRSASRTGYSDFGVNRKRIEALRLALQQAKVIE